MSEPTAKDFRRPDRSDAPVRASVVIAVLDEAENVAAVCEETLAAMERAGPCEIVFVDDGSTDATPDILQDIAAKDARLRLVRHDRRCGKSQAVRSGVLAARAPWIATRSTPPLDEDAEDEDESEDSDPPPHPVSTDPASINTAQDLSVCLIIMVSCTAEQIPARQKR